MRSYNKCFHDESRQEFHRRLRHATLIYKVCEPCNIGRGQIWILLSELTFLCKLIPGIITVAFIVLGKWAWTLWSKLGLTQMLTDWRINGRKTGSLYHTMLKAGATKSINSAVTTLCILAECSDWIECASDWWSGGCGFYPRRVRNILS